ncbi:MAG: DUF4434 domain-containing protein [Paludibacteraceae bacterium]|nr:DUF4434 domain-containing protein [Paludibacteraceae bacterium]
MNKFNLALLSLLLSFTCFANIDGTFIQTWLYSYWTDERWEAEISSMKEIGIQEIIMADIASRSNSNEPWSCSYPSQLSNTSLSADETTKILKQAKKGGVKVYLGLGCDSRWWNWNLCNDNDYQEFAEAMTMSCKFARELYSTYKTEFSNTFSGFYSVYEIWNHIEWNNPHRRSIYAQRMAEQFNRLIDTLNAIDPSMPLLFSPFATQADWCANIENTQAFYEEFFQKCHFREIDEMLPMDNIGGGGQTLATVNPWCAMYANVVANNNGIPQCNANIESFVQPADSLLYDTNTTPLFGVNYWGSAPIGRFVQQLEIAKNYANKIYTFAYAHYQSPLNNIPGIHKNLAQYLHTGEIDSIYPTLPQKVKYEMFDIENNSSSKHIVLKLTWSDDFYDEMGILRVNLYKEGECVAFRTSTRSENGNIAHEPDFLLYPNYSKSDKTQYELGFVDTWGNECKSSPFCIDLDKGENDLSENTHLLSTNSEFTDYKANVQFIFNSETTIYVKTEGWYNIDFYTLSGVLKKNENLWLNKGKNYIKVSDTPLLQPMVILVKEISL